MEIEEIWLKWFHLYFLSWKYLCPPAEPHSGPSQASKMDLFLRIVGSFELRLLTAFAKSSIVDTWRDPEYNSDLFCWGPEAW